MENENGLSRDGSRTYVGQSRTYVGRSRTQACLMSDIRQDGGREYEQENGGGRSSDVNVYCDS